MMRFSQNFLFLIFIATFWSCNQSSKKENVEKPSGLKNGKLTQEEFGSCDTSDKGVSVRYVIWIPSDSVKASARIREELNQKIIDRINSHADSASIASKPGAKKSVKEAFTVFAKNYLDFKTKFADAPGCWEVDLKGDTVMVTPKVFLYQLDHYSFTGGAHPNSFKSFHIFDGSTGEEKDAKLFISDTSAFKVKVEAAFKKVEKLPSDADLEEQGYFLNNHQFFLPANYIFTQQGVLFYYNPYEIAPYARGAIQFVIPYGELEGVVKREMIF